MTAAHGGGHGRGLPWLAPIRNSCELRGLCCRSCFGPRTCGRGITNIPKRFGALNQGFPFSHLQCRQGRTRMDEGAAMCTVHAVFVLCFGCWQGLANRSMRIQDLYVGPVPIPRFIKEYSYSLFGTSWGFVISFSGSYVLWRFISPFVVE